MRLLSESRSMKLCTSRRNWILRADSGLHVHPGPWMPCGAGGVGGATVLRAGRSGGAAGEEAGNQRPEDGRA